MAKRTLSDAEYDDWLQKHDEATLVLDNRERRIRESYSRLEMNLTLLGEYIRQVLYLFTVQLWYCSLYFYSKHLFSLLTHYLVDN
jgi:hypothetical protein